MRASWIACIGVGTLIAGSAFAQTYRPPAHNLPPPPIFARAAPHEIQVAADGGVQLEHDRPARWTLAEHRRLGSALAALQPQRKGVVDAYVVSIALDSDPVFGREAREAGRVLSRRFGAEGRAITLAGTDGSGPTQLPNGTMTSLALALARVAEVMDPEEDVLVLYTTSHGAPLGIAYHDGDEGYGILPPARYAALLDELGIKRRLLMISACYSGVFIPSLASADTALLTAASSERPSFGCLSDNDWTFFGDALINHALRKAQPLAAAAAEAVKMIGGWEAANRFDPSNPQVSIGADVAKWLAPLEARMPKAATAPVGRPSTDALKGAR